MEKTEFLIKRKYKEFTIKDVETLLDIFKYNYCLFETGITPQNTYNHSYNYKVSAKYCYITHELRLHQNDRCKRFTPV